MRVHRAIFLLLLITRSMQACEPYVQPQRRPAPLEFYHYPVACVFAQIDQLMTTLAPQCKSICDQQGRTLLHYAAHYGAVKIVTFLLAVAPELAMQFDLIGNMPSSYAFDGNFQDCAAKLLLASESFSPCATTIVHEDVIKDCRDRINEMLALIDNVRFSRDTLGRSMLHYAARFGALQTARLVIALAPELVVAGDRIGRTPLHEAAAHGHREVIELLLKNGADPSHVDRYGLAPMRMLTENHRPIMFLGADRYFGAQSTTRIDNAALLLRIAGGASMAFRASLR